MYCLREATRVFALLNLIQVSYGGVAQGLAYATIALASLIPCSIMAIGASNLFANNIYRDLINPSVNGTKLTLVTRSMVFVVIGLALLFGLLFPSALVSLQLLGVSGMVQIFFLLLLLACSGKKPNEGSNNNWTAYWLDNNIYCIRNRQFIWYL
ncbi:hypothetical protein GCM10020331_074750 [Ectobacillus funiculus]